MKRMRRIRSKLAVLMVVSVATPAAIAQQGGSNIAATKHNLTSTGPGPVKTSGGGEVCVFCHTPHAASPAAPLWNRQDPGTYYQTYESSTAMADIDQPTGPSRLCLSCHDGTIALNQTYNGRNMPGSAVYLSQADRGYLGTDLSDDHPISFHYTAGLAAQKGQLRDPSAIPPQLPLDHDGQLQCTTCHDPHDDSLGKFLRMDNADSQMCRSCHEITGWTSSAHATTAAPLTSASRDQWDNLQATTVAGAGCESCHRPHSAGGRQRLLRHEAEEDNCFNCHDQTVARTDMVREFQKLSTHPVGNATGVHDPTENPLNMTEHVECADCHHPHRVGESGIAQAPFVRPAMAGVSGMSDTGHVLGQATYEYEVCYKCHSQRNFAQTVVNRELGNDNIADEFSPSNASYHPVQTTGRNTDVPSLTQQYTTTSMIYCTDCHGSDDADTRGPHGSLHRPLLVANYSTINNTMESSAAYALCYRCHNRNSILGDESFKKHERHINEEHTPCSVCHDPHGVQSNTNLINFDREVVGPAQSTGQGPTFTDLGNRRGSCTLNCHGEEHVDEEY